MIINLKRDYAPCLDLRSSLMGSSKPTPEIVCVCENVLIDARGTASLISIIERMEAQIPEGLTPELPAGFPVKAFLRLRAHEPGAKGGVRLVVRKPDGTVGADAIMPVEFKDLPRANFQATFEMHVVQPQNGIYTFEFSWNQEPLTSVSIEVAIKPVPRPVPIQPPAN